MRGAWAIAAAVLLAAPARADVLVPADPPRRDAGGLSSVGDIVAYELAHDTAAALAGGTEVELAGGRPLVAAAADGTAVIATFANTTLTARIRRPGAGFAAPVHLGKPAAFASAAAAPGGWTAAAWVSWEDDRIEAAVVDPGGTVHGATLERTTDVLSIPQVGIDASGHATVAWSRWRVYDGGDRATRQRVRLARFGTTWSAPEELEHSGASPVFDLPTWAQVALAVTPGGHSLLAWATRDGVKASLDGAPPQLLATLRDAGSPTAALAEDGSAVVAYARNSEEILATDRAAGGAWSAPHRISGTPVKGEPPEGYPFPTSDGDDGANDVELTSAVGADGRAVVTWLADVAAVATGHAGGAWTRAREVSTVLGSPLLTPRAALDATGNPFVSWVEASGLSAAGTPRAAVLVPVALAPPPDTAAPKLETKLPATIRITRTGKLELTIPVRCSEDCDAFIGLAYPADEHEYVLIRARRLRAGVQAHIAVRPASYERIGTAAYSETRMRVVVEVADRAGNVARARRTARVRKPASRPSCTCKTGS
jgi:hypothetical protein